jgi:Spy/CpxP family protein refolding chaperone
MSFPNPLKHWKILLVMSAIFVFGLVCGSVLTAGALGKVAVRILSMEGWSNRTVKDLKRHLQLTPGQEQKIRALAEQHQPEVMGIRNETFMRFGAVHKQLSDEVLPVLTPEQAAKFKALNQRREAEFRKTFKLQTTNAPATRGSAGR